MFEKMDLAEKRYDELARLLSDPETVSYTHLDVYKRQGLHHVRSD